MKKQRGGKEKVPFPFPFHLNQNISAPSPPAHHVKPSVTIKNKGAENGSDKPHGILKTWMATSEWGNYHQHHYSASAPQKSSKTTTHTQKNTHKKRGDAMMRNQSRVFKKTFSTKEGIGDSRYWNVGIPRNNNPLSFSPLFHPLSRLCFYS